MQRTCQGTRFLVVVVPGDWVLGFFVTCMVMDIFVTRMVMDIVTNAGEPEPQPPPLGFPLKQQRLSVGKWM